MAGSQTCHSSRHNPLSAGKDKLAGCVPGATTNSSDTPAPTLTPAVSHSSIPTLAPALAPSGGTYTDVDL